MASEIRVNKIENRSGLGTVTFADTGVDLAGIVTATTFSGSGASLTALPAAQLSGTLPAISAANLTNVPAANITGTLPALSAASLTNVPAANVVGVHTSLTVTNATTTGTVVVGGGVTISESGIEASGIGITCANINGAQIGGRRNLIINGAMNVAQRGTSSTSAGYQTVDRIKPYTDNIGVTPTYSQVDVTSGGAYDAGFRKAWQVTKGAGTANTNSQVNMGYRIEAQDVANSGWKYTDPNSSITISFWLKTSVSNHNPQLLVMDNDTSTSSTKYYFVDIPALTANTWTKITQTIPGHADQIYNNDTGTGIEFQIIAWYGTDYTDSGNTPNAWGSFGTKPVNTTWLTTNNSTFQVTGIQLEVGSQATAFEHRSVGDELALCKRYFQQFPQGPADAYGPIASGRIRNSTNAHLIVFFSEMRSSPTCTKVGNLRIIHAATSTGVNSVASSHMAKNIIFIEGIVSSGLTQGEGCIMSANNDSSGKITLSAEL